MTTPTPDPRAPAPPPRCAICGERIRPGRAPGTWTHVARLVASCDLDSDHPAVPDQAGGSSSSVTGTSADTR